jgi:intracellular septation protein
MITWVKNHTLFKKNNLKKFIFGLFLDFSPPFVFVIVFEITDFYIATGWFVATTVCMSIIALLIEKRIPYFSLYISLVTFIFGSWTIVLRDPDFIQMRDTFYDIVLALTLYFGLLRGKLFLRTAFEHTIIMIDTAWRKITKSWIVYFIVGAVANEVARRYLDEEGWIYFKIITLFTTVIFTFCVLFYFYEPHQEDKRTS